MILSKERNLCQDFSEIFKYSPGLCGGSDSVSAGYEEAIRSSRVKHDISGNLCLSGDDILTLERNSFII